MPTNRLPRQLFSVLLVIAAIQTANYYPKLPAVVVSHFDGRGVANGWESKDVFFGIYWGVIALCALLAFGVPKLVTQVPASFINLPNKDYWLAKEKRQETISFIERQMAWFGTAALAMAAGVFELVIRANLAADHRLSSPTLVALLVSYALFVIWWVYHFFAKFRLKSQRCDNPFPSKPRRCNPSR